LVQRPSFRGLDAVSSLEHFAIVTYAVPPERLRPHVHPRFEMESIRGDDGLERALVSIVPFEDHDFRFVRIPWPRFRMGQTNYRAYVVDRITGEHVVWFFGTTLGSWTVNVPRTIWRLPWHGGRVTFDCRYDEAARRYSRYRLVTRSKWAPVELELEDTGLPLRRLAGFPDFEHGRMVLTHPFKGVYFRRDGKLGSYEVWHRPLQLTTAAVIRAEIGLFAGLGLVPISEQAQPHSVLLQRATEFGIKLPPRLMAVASP
jgi:hypothetical protein